MILLRVDIEPSQVEAGSVTVGWLLTDREGAVLYDAPRRLRGDHRPRSHAKSASACPAILNLESRLFEIVCPFDLRLGLAETQFGEAAVKDLAGAMSPMRGSALDRLVIVSPRSEWRHPDRPILQLRLPYLFVADEPVYMAQLPPFQHYRSEPLPGLTLSGRFPIHIWPRPLTWAFEWHATDSPLVLRRGEPLFYVQFETEPATRPVQLVEAERTAALDTYLKEIEGVVNYVNQTFSLMKSAEERRPQKLVRPVQRG
ncbi:hypothetical protein DKT77_13310 [Meridianimarinicoccus roseus]|uniref:Uncharacterized protein n=1 Tax=Meridianimarinicoccus roseus TaxID=2072018 RepID=A0A2V2LI89_9RHOB|nr:hypothetical protein [Meridianimarinicoccus roseus]PWR02129.1 hypothetical protein DKT77_13310 [Meridianimarinicoccus roseus]